MSAPIPADILEAALKLSSWTFGSSDDKDVMEVAAVLLAEREAQKERDAKIAENIDPLNHDTKIGLWKSICAAIRNPHADRGWRMSRARLMPGAVVVTASASD